MLKYFHGFSLRNEECLFEAYTASSAYCVAGFSYGAQKALEYAYAHKGRIDKLILLSPAFFQNQKPSFIRTQLRYFQADKAAYVKTFLENVSFPSTLSLDSYLEVGTAEELESLLTYVWDEKKIEALQKRGVEIEVFLGEKDKIIDVQSSLDFFKPLVCTYTFKNRGHSLKN